MYHVTQYLIHPEDNLFPYCEKMSKLANNMYNVALYYMRQVMTAMDKIANNEPLQDNEKAVLKEIEDNLPKMNAIRKADKPFSMPTPKKKIFGSQFLDTLFKVTNNPDYNSDLPKQTSQHMIKQACQDTKAFFAAIKEYKKRPDAFTGKPELPHYKKSGGFCTVEFTNQDSVIYGRYLKLPKTTERFDVGTKLHGRLKSLEIKPYCGNFKLILTLDDEVTVISEPCVPTRIASIDFGVNNIAAIANNVGLPGLLFKGNAMKAENQWFNKKRASILHGLTVGQEKPKQYNCESLKILSMKSDGYMTTNMHRISNEIVLWCTNNNIDTLVLGHTKYWKEETSMGKQNNQNFVDIPFAKLQNYLRYKAERCGIQVIDKEESYTSKASFLDNDFIPTYGKEKGKPAFSGHRIKRGLYKSKNGTIINADLNGAANILRKAFPNAFEGQTEFPFFDNIYTQVCP